MSELAESLVEGFRQQDCSFARVCLEIGDYLQAPLRLDLIPAIILGLTRGSNPGGKILRAACRKTLLDGRLSVTFTLERSTG